MVFYPYDLNNYLSSERGFYFTYTDFVPGPIAYNEEELIMIIKKGQFDLKKVEKYKKECFDFFDGKASKRVVDLFFK
jgi:CDP-ribitol ribitolphosphotransferase